MVAYVAGAACNVALGAAQSVLGAPYPVELGMTAMSKLDLGGTVVQGNLATGFFSHPNSLAMLLIPSSILLAGWATNTSATFRTRVLCLILLGPLYFVLYKTYSKGAYVWALWGLLFLLSLRATKVYNTTVWASALILSVVLVAGISLWRNYDIAGLGTMRGRWNQWAATAAVILDHPGILLWGNGSGDLSWKSLVMSRMSYTYPNAHMWWLNQLLLYGVIPFVALVGSLWSLIKSGCTQLSARREQTQERLIIGACVMALLGIYSFEPTVEGTTLQCQLFLLLAVFSKYGKLAALGREGR